MQKTCSFNSVCLECLSVRACAGLWGRRDAAGSPSAWHTCGRRTVRLLLYSREEACDFILQRVNCLRLKTCLYGGHVLNRIKVSSFRATWRQLELREVESLLSPEAVSLGERHCWALGSDLGLNPSSIPFLLVTWADHLSRPRFSRQHSEDDNASLTGLGWGPPEAVAAGAWHTVGAHWVGLLFC